MEETGSQPEGNLKKAYPALVKIQEWKQATFAIQISAKRKSFQFKILLPRKFEFQH